MLEKEKIERINYLAKKQKCEGLDDSEKTEQSALREEYLCKFRTHFKDHLDRIKFVEDIDQGTGDINQDNQEKEPKK